MTIKLSVPENTSHYRNTSKMQHLLINWKSFFLCDLEFFCVAETVFVGKWRLRAMEQFDTLRLKYGNHIEKETTSGIGPTINFWWEEACDNSF